MPAAPTAPMMGVATYSTAPIEPIYSAPAVPLPPVQSQQVSYGVQQVSQIQVIYTILGSFVEKVKI